MGIQDILLATYNIFLGLPKKKIIEAILTLREKYRESEAQNQKLREENAKLKALINQQKLQDINKSANKPSSKKAEWEDKSSSRAKGKRKKRKRISREGAGNRAKNSKLDRREKKTVVNCDLCGKDLSDQAPLISTNKRIIEDIPEPKGTEVFQVIQEKKYCDDCKAVVTAKSELALPGADIGLNATVLICYLWVALCLPYTKIKDYLKTFFGLKISTAGLSSHVIRVSEIMKSVHEEILQDIRIGTTLFADETGWRVRGKNWWLWVFGTENSAYFTVDKTRSSDVVRRVLGEIFFGVLVVDGWSAYLSLICQQQTCMAHLFRKIRKFRDSFPHLVNIVKFYVKLRRIIRDGEQLQEKREELGEEVFQRRLKKLHERLEKLVTWPNPDEILEEIIKKVKRQQPRILTFVEHPDVPSHNNYAEFLIRIGVLKRKISGGSVSAEGANAYAILLSIYVTCKLRKISFPKFFKESLKQYIKTGTPMSLKDYSEEIYGNIDLKDAA